MLMHDLTLGPVSPIVALLFAALGVLLGILLATRARQCTGIRRARLVAYAAVAVALPAVWLPALVAIMALRVDGSVLLITPIPLATSLATAFVGTSAGLLLLCYGRSSRTDRILAAGILLVGTIAGTGYLLLHGLRTGGDVIFRAPFAAAALGLAAVTGLALTGALAVTPTLRAAVLVSGGLGALMSACQHLGTASMAVRLGPQGPVPAYDITGTSPLVFGLPAVVLCGALIAMMWYFTVGAATSRDLRRTFQHGAQTEQIEPSIVAEVRARVSLSSTALVAAGIGEVWAQGTLPMRAIPLYGGGITGAFARPLPARMAQEQIPQPQDDEPSWELAGVGEPIGQPEPGAEQPWRAVPDWGLPTAAYVEQPELDTAGWLAQGREAGAAGHWEQSSDADAAARNEQRGARRARPTNSRYGPMPRRGTAANSTATQPERVPVAHWGGGSGELPTITRADGGGPLPRRNSR
jgi:hypothetical protein